MSRAHLFKTAFDRLILAIINANRTKVSALLKNHPGLATHASTQGASRENPQKYFFKKIRHYLYAGDTALHMAAAAMRPAEVKILLDLEADPNAKNRRGAGPLHYATDGGPGLSHWRPAAQIKTVNLLIQAGADPNLRDKSGVCPLHRAVRNRCFGAVKALFENGARPNQKNSKGSTPLQLARQTTGRGGSGTPEAKRLQTRIIRLLLATER